MQAFLYLLFSRFAVIFLNSCFPFLVRRPSLFRGLFVGLHVPNPLQDFPLARLLDLARQDELVQNGVHL